MGASHSVRKKYESKRDAARDKVRRMEAFGERFHEPLEGPGILYAKACTETEDHMVDFNVAKGFHQLPNGQCVEILPGVWPS